MEDDVSSLRTFHFLGFYLHIFYVFVIGRPLQVSVLTSESINSLAKVTTLRTLGWETILGGRGAQCHHMSPYKEYRGQRERNRENSEVDHGAEGVQTASRSWPRHLFRAWRWNRALQTSNRKRSSKFPSELEVDGVQVRQLLYLWVSKQLPMVPALSHSVEVTNAEQSSRWFREGPALRYGNQKMT